jgi:hypothetical protein
MPLQMRRIPLLPPLTPRVMRLPLRAMPLLRAPTQLPAPPPMRALPLPMRALTPLMPLRMPRTLPPTPRRKPLRRRSKRLLYGLNGRADGVVNPRLPPAVLFPGP